VSNVYSSQLASGVGVGAGLSLLGTVPAGKVWVVRAMACFYSTAISAPLAGFSVPVNDNVALWGVGPLGVAAFTVYRFDGRDVLNPGDELGFYSPDSTDWNIIVSGYSLTLP
jgi:hypothetical protein